MTQNRQDENILEEDMEIADDFLSEIAFCDFILEDEEMMIWIEDNLINPDIDDHLDYDEYEGCMCSA